MSNGTNSNASPSAFGWQFQVNSGIYLMLDDLKRYKSINVEGEFQDIELTTKEGKLELVQAKATYRPNMHHKDGLERKKYTDKQSEKASRAIKGLFESFNKKESCDSIIYLFNAEYVFGTKANYLWSHGETRRYNELRTKEIEVVDKIIDAILKDCPDYNNLKTLLCDKLIFKKLNYENLQDWKTSHLQLLDKISAFLEDLGISKHRNEEYLLTMQALCNHDTQDKRYTKTDEDFVWVALALDLDFRADSFASSFPDFDADAQVALAYLRHRPEFDSTRVGGIGHSEGAFVAFSLAGRKEVDFMYINNTTN